MTGRNGEFMQGRPLLASLTRRDVWKLAIIILNHLSCVYEPSIRLGQDVLMRHGFEIYWSLSLAS